MNKELKYVGLSNIPSDYECADGEMSLALNLIHEEGALHPVAEPDTVLTLPSSDYYVIFIHKNSSYTHYIIAKRNDTGLWWIDSNLSEPSEEDITRNFIHNFQSPIKKIESIGHTLIVLTNQDLHYLLWKSENNSFRYLGTKLPFPIISLALGATQGDNSIQSYTDELRLCSATYTDINNSVNGYLGNKFSSNTGGNSVNYIFSNRDPEIVRMKKSFADQIIGSANLFIAEQQKAGVFTEPFFVRYALRLYNGSHTMHSAPILMIPNSSFRAIIDKVSLEKDSGFTASTILQHYIARLLFRIIDDANIKDWSDIVTHIDFFISTPIYTYDQSKEELDIEDFKNHKSTGSTNGPSKFFSFSHIGSYGYAEGDTRAEDHRQPSDPIKNPVISFNSGNYEVFYDYELPTQGARWSIERKRSEIESDIKGQKTALFYLLKSFEIDKVKTMDNYSIVNDEAMSLENIQTHERLEDDYQSHHSIIPSFTYAFNGRLHLANIKQQLFSGFKLDSSTQFTEANPEDENKKISRVKVYVKVKKEGASQWITENVELYDLPYKLNENYFPRWLFYPDSGATQMIIVEYGEDNDIFGYWSLPLTTHESLEGSYWFRGLSTDLPDYEETTSLPSEIQEAINSGQNNVIYLNKIYTSEVYNPFYFPVNNIVTVGTGKILGICSAARPLSQGQFGQFPLYAFTDEGVWALEVSDTGTYTARQPITRDVCINSDSICPIDSAVLFTTDRGIMLISGSTVSPITDSINGDTVFDITSLPSFKTLIDKYAPELYSEIYEILSWSPSFTYYPFPNKFSRLLPSLRMVYDYTNQRILAFVPDSTNRGYSKTPCLIYSLKSKSWGMADYKIESPVNSYPDAIVMTNEGKLLNLSSKIGSIRPNQLIVTRPFKLGAPDTFKTIDTFVNRGFFPKDRIKMVLYGSRDMFNWHIVWTSQQHFMRGFRGSPYKYYRMVMLCNFKAEESLYGATVQFTPKYTNDIR